MAVIGDMVESRALSSARRATAQRHFTSFVDLLNRRFRRSIASKFVITLGDEFQGLLSGPADIPDIIWSIDMEFRDRDVRLGFGFGRLYTPIRPVALNVDGPVLHRARAAITEARRKKILGGIFEGFREYDPILNGFARALRHLRDRMTDRQRTVLSLLRNAGTQVETAKKLRVSKQAVSGHVLAAGWDAYVTAEIGWKTALDLAVMRKSRR